MGEQGETRSLPPDSERDADKIARILALDIRQFPQYREDPSFAWQRDGSRYALHAVQDAVRRGFLTPDHFRQVVDFGAGGGGPTFLLDQICKITGGSVEAMENNEYGPEQLAVLKTVVPSVPVYTGDGLDELKRMNGTATLVTAFTFGPDYSGEFFPKIANAASQTLTDNGKLLLFSDPRSQRMMLRHLLLSGISGSDLQLVPGQNANDTYRHIPETAILSKHGASLIK